MSNKEYLPGVLAPGIVPWQYARLLVVYEQ